MADPTRPLPDLRDLDTRAFWLATKDKRLTYQQCADCGAVVFYPRRRCSSCLSANLEWKESAGEGTVYTYSIVAKATTRSSAAWRPTPSPGSTSTKARASCRT